jgi:hypothetical protein
VQAAPDSRRLGQLQASAYEYAVVGLMDGQLRVSKIPATVIASKDSEELRIGTILPPIIPSAVEAVIAIRTCHVNGCDRVSSLANRWTTGRRKFNRRVLINFEEFGS